MKESEVCPVFLTKAGGGATAPLTTIAREGLLFSAVSAHEPEAKHDRNSRPTSLQAALSPVSLGPQVGQAASVSTVTSPPAR